MFYEVFSSEQPSQLLKCSDVSRTNSVPMDKDLRDVGSYSGAADLSSFCDVTSHPGNLNQHGLVFTAGRQNCLNKVRLFVF